MRKRFFLRCKACGEQQLTMHQIVEAENEEDMQSELLGKMFCHEGFGWELEDFIMTCVKCSGKDFEVGDEEVTGG